MNKILYAAKLGINRGWIEFRESLTNVQDVIWSFIVGGILIAVLFFQKDTMIGPISLSLLTLPGLLGMSVAMGGIMGMSSSLSMDREDGTLLRAKAIPQGMTGYLVSRVVWLSLSTVQSLLFILIPGIFLVQGLTTVGFGDWLLLLAVMAAGLLATLPWGAVIGSLVKTSSSGMGLSLLPIAGITAISGIFYPITALAGWLQGIAQVFPVYWLGHGMRAALLPDEVAAMELSGSWQLLHVFIVLGVWAIAGLILAPRILRRMAKRESGSAVEARKQHVMSRGY
jgi:ABC-2 type transport system permease protein